MSALIYLSTFFLSIVCLYLYEHIKGKGIYIYLRHFFSIIGIMLPCFLAAFRDASVGTDTIFYQQFYIYATEQNSFWSYHKLIDNELAYDCLIYFCANYLKSYHSFLFLSQSLVIVPIYLFALKMKHQLHGNITVTMVMFVYYMLFYNMTLNNMRQGISASFLILAFGYWDEKYRIKAIMIGLIATLFHLSAVIGVLLIVAASFLLQYRNNGARKSMSLILLLGFFITIMMLPQIAWFTYTNHLIPYSIYHYTERYILGEGRVNMSVGKITMLIMRIGLLLLPLILHEKIADYKVYRKTEMQIIVGTTIFASFFIIYQNILAYRVTIFQDYFFMIFFPQALSNRNYMRKDAKKAFLIAYLLVYWWFYYMYEGWNGTYPFVFAVS